MEPSFELDFKIPGSTQMAFEIGSKEGIVSIRFDEGSIFFTHCLFVQFEFLHHKNSNFFDPSILSLNNFALYKVKDRPLVYDLMILNRVHERHQDRMFNEYLHFIIKSRDIAFECIASGYNYE